MKLNWNPQLLRELKGRLKPRNILLTIALSLVGQFIIVLISFQTQLLTRVTSDIFDKYCAPTFGENLDKRYQLKCLPDEYWQSWWRDIFVGLGLIGIVILLVAGTYMLINDLATEERRGTFNLTRLSPQSEKSIFIGKLLGVPILIYLFTALALPLHLYSGLAAKIPLSLILSFYAVVAVASVFYYSAAMLFGLVGSWLGSFQAWLGSGAVLIFLMLTKGISTTSYFNSTTWLKLLNPFCLIPNLSTTSFFEGFATGLERFKWFHFVLSGNVLTIVGFVLLNYGILTGFIWQSLQRCFRDQNATMLSKQQSYLLTVCFTVLTIGCANYAAPANRSPYALPLTENLFALSLLNFLLFLYLIAAITPHRQALQDWARYRHQRVSSSKKLGYNSLVQDLIWGEKNPAVVAIAINLIIVIIFLAFFILLSPAQQKGEIPYRVDENRTWAFFGLALNSILLMIYASFAQLVLFMRIQQRALWTASALGATILLPSVISRLLGINGFSPLELFIYPFVLLLGNTVTAVWVIVVAQLLVLVLLNLQLTRQLRLAGDSTSKALFKSGK
ncbi:ABC transporter permease [Scytonema tolypothrichoides VB-61278]|nr:ABC transporter permease [Scytonema tolypothrichoides VB-61278]